LRRRRLRLGRPGSYFFGASGGLGFGISAAVGVQLAQPGRPVVCVLGEGSAQYAITGLWSAVAYEAPVPFLVLRNEEYAILKWFGSIEGVDGAPGLDLPELDLGGLDFTLPSELEAAEPPEARGLTRDQVRLLVSYPAGDRIVHADFRNLPHFLSAGDLLVVNQTRVRRARLAATDSAGRQVELLVLRRCSDATFLCLSKPAKRAPPGAELRVNHSLAAVVVAASADHPGARLVRFDAEHGEGATEAHEHAAAQREVQHLRIGERFAQPGDERVVDQGVGRGEALGVAAAHGACFKGTFPVGATTDAQAVKSLPGFSCQPAIHTFETNVLRHC